ncbi:MAG: hypothetical protein WA813_02520 [Beijerinckiaceae bacterium]
MSNRLTIALVAFLAFLVSNDGASARGGGFGAGGFHGGGVFHRGFGGRLHVGLFHGRGFGGRFHEANLHRFAGGFFQGGFRNEVRNGLSATGLGLLIQAKIASYFDSLLSQYPIEAGGSGGGANCDARCISSRYLRNTENPSTSEAKGVDIPQYDVNHNCTTLQGIPTRNFCLRTEQENYDTLKSLWTNIPGRVRDQTLAKMQGITGGHSTVTYPYTMMKGYLIAYLQADELTRPAEPFHY